MPKQTHLKLWRHSRVSWVVHPTSKKNHENPTNYPSEFADLSYVLWACPGMPNHSHQKRLYQLVERIDIEILHNKGSCNLIRQDHFCS